MLLTSSGATIMTTSTTPTIVLAHGAFADASGFAGVIRELQSADHTVVAPPGPESSGVLDPTVERGGMP
jgi:hypothetical protein